MSSLTRTVTMTPSLFIHEFLDWIVDGGFDLRIDPEIIFWATDLVNKKREE